MPDQYGFNQLGNTVRCIDCSVGGPIWQWPEAKRQRHAHRHSSQCTADVRRQRNLLAAPSSDHHEEKEATTMATTQKKGEPAKQVAIDILRRAGEPLHAKEIAKRVLASGRCASLKGQTPEATISAMLAVGSKPGGPFRRVDKGTYTLAHIASASNTSAQQKPAAAKPTRAQASTSARTKAKSAKTPRKRAAAKRSR